MTGDRFLSADNVSSQYWSTFVDCVLSAMYENCGKP